MTYLPPMMIVIIHFILKKKYEEKAKGVDLNSNFLEKN